MDGNPVDTNALPAEVDSEGESWGSFAGFVLKLALVVLVFRSFVFSPFSIPSESMLPRLWNGDYLLAAKWPYGFSKYSLPFELPLIPGRVLAGQPERGDVVIFKHPVDGTDYIKRVIGLPGDTIDVRGGRVVLNGRELEYRAAPPALIPPSPNTPCHSKARLIDSHEGRACAYNVSLEVLPSGKSYPVIDLGLTQADNRRAVIVPEGGLFVMGDNRDNSQDSRFEARPGGGVGLVPQELLVGRATVIMWSTDGSAEWIKPWTWFTAARWGRMGNLL
jgi:signal peptidase I